MEIYNSTDTPVKYWSNACGDFHYHGEYYISEGELPRILREAYKNYWSECYRLPCYLGEINEDFRLLFIFEADEDYVQQFYHCDIDTSFSILQRIAQRLEKYSAFSCADFILEKGTGFNCCHQLIISVPATIDKETFVSFVKALESHF